MKFKQLLPITLSLLIISLPACFNGDDDSKLWHESDETPTAPAVLSPTIFTELAQSQRPAVVNISTTRVIKNHPQIFDTPLPPGHPGGGSRRGRNPFENFFDHFFGGRKRKFKQRSLGSGFIISKEGYIITNAHVVDDVDEIKVTLANKKEFDAKVIGTDQKTDIALIKIEAWKDLPVVKFGDSDNLEVGEWVVAIGNPFGLEHTVTSGIISATGRVIGAGPYDDYIQTDASINPGNSGGPLFNLHGEVIGINTAIIPEGQGIGFAIPINMAKDILKDLKDKGEVTRGWLGLLIQQVTPGLAKSFGLDEANGALVSEVVPNSPAEKAGFKQGDVVVKFDGEEIENHNELSRLAAKTRPGTKVEIEILRDGKYKSVYVTLGTLPKDERMALLPSKVTSRLGMQVENITQQLKSFYELEDESGVVVTKVEPYSPADKAKITPGTVIVTINRKPIPDLETYQTIINNSKSKDTLLYLVKQGSHTFYLTITVP